MDRPRGNVAAHRRASATGYGSFPLTCKTDTRQQGRHKPNAVPKFTASAARFCGFDPLTLYSQRLSAAWVRGALTVLWCRAGLITSAPIV